jgi:catechol 2,3-dioxygenase-like lactoylglutathione lyase family enzyme
MASSTDDRPTVWVGHVVATAHDLDAATDFYETIGMRRVHRDDDIAIFELRGGTHLVVQPDAERAPGPLDFDLMVDDVAATRAAWAAAGLTVSEMTATPIHESFTVQDPSGNSINVSSTHVVGPV